MKKTIIISAIALGFAFNTSNAATFIEDVPFSTVVKKSKVEVSPFCMAIVKGDIETVKKLIQLGADVNAKSNGMTPAMYAAKYNKTEILEVLVKEGADLKKKSQKGLTAMDYAKQSKAIDAMAYLDTLS
ncbi:ankyrin repeat domain-containing protein [Gelidibacter salicanalis]|uniref:Ankyrin repeat domain-containing protein n=1 Tax=Gelidibacter salicanalis TaxID=291193 RepID=A0A934NG37_9FLAO|nr:ankyrin repeat domain-containing protein [Gelidibacter salicanalis]MBJ7879106.1 ankyrin repeat domain-containing protein [Gelidibacter salicanalis]